jgi:hypothetical protein
VTYRAVGGVLVNDSGDSDNLSRGGSEEGGGSAENLSELHGCGSESG